jgi:hypothetical protein
MHSSALQKLTEVLSSGVKIIEFADHSPIGYA